MKNNSPSWQWALRLLPFLSWFPVTQIVLRSDLIAGFTGALVLVPKAMAYAHLAGMPVHFGLYAAFVPAIFGALWGSSRQLATGPVAVISIMTAAALTPLAAPFSREYVELALLLTLMVGLIQFALGTLKLGAIVNFVSHPVLLGFVNAAAIIIALSQIDVLLGIPKGRSDSFLSDIWEMRIVLTQAHWPTVLMSVFALTMILTLRKIPWLANLSVLIAVAITIVASYAFNFERTASSQTARIADDEARSTISAYAEADKRIRELGTQLPAQAATVRKLESTNARGAAEQRHQLHLGQLDAADLATENKQRLQAIGQMLFYMASQPDGGALYVAGRAPEGVMTDARPWRIRKIEGDQLHLVGGGEVVGKISPGLPSFRPPSITLDGLLSLISVAMVIALVALMESMAMAKALAARTKQRINPNQELIGQGMANLGGSFFQSYPVAGSFTGSAINLDAGAKTGFAMVFNGLFVIIALLFFTPYLYHLPKATLAVIILLAINSLVSLPAMLHAWRAKRSDGMVAWATFFITLVSAPHLDKGILAGAALAILLYLYRTMRPRVALLGRHADGTLRDVLVYPNLPTSDNVIAFRFDDSLYFANAPFFEDAILGAIAKQPKAKYLLVVAGGINQMDATGEEVVRHLVQRLAASGVTLVFCSLKRQVLDVLHNTGLYDVIGADKIFPSEDTALEAIYAWLGNEAKHELLSPANVPATESAVQPPTGTP